MSEPESERERAMSAFLSVTGDRFSEGELENRGPGSASLKFTVTILVASLIVTVVVSCCRSYGVQASEGLQATPDSPAADSTGQADFATAMRWTLKKQQDRMIQLAIRLIGRAEPRTDPNDQLVHQRISTEKAKANFSNAQLSREIAEIAAVEYEEGIFVQDRATAEGELKLAQSDLQRARDSIALAKDQLDMIKRASKGSAADLANEFTFADIQLNAQRRLPKSERALAQVQFKLKALVEYTKPKRIKELRSEVERAKFDELAKRAAWEFEQSKVKVLEQAIKAQDLASGKTQVRDSLDRQALASLDRAVSVEGKLRSKLDGVTKNGKPDDALQKETQDLANQLQALIDQAEFERSAAEFDEWNARIHAAAK
jgi:hypothetical protein